ncbi:c-type cytochrome [Thaumasiovibrio subtropicus]|uniref:c-type cytochrome n=1 Tax=Thaumasiovibrio subtropicus TaxID=1891207 RepID=UPI000B35358D|nr:c-type cytochrome [Thaumasiovibrio subtropicus]
MKKLALILALAASHSVLAAGDIESGKALATSKTCVACHGSDGVSLIPENPNLAGQHENYLAKQLHEFKLGMSSGGKEGRVNAVMGGMSIGLSDQDIADLAAFYASLTPPDGTTPESSVEVGHQLYYAGDPERGLAACTACHGPRGNGTASSGFPRISGQHADYIKAQLMQFRAGERANDMNEMMRSVAIKLTDEEIEALAGYLGGLH